MRELDRDPGTPGADVQLTIDARLQNFVQARLAGESAAAVVIDCETLRTTLRARYGLSDRVDIEVELPILYAWGGVLDGVIEGYHSTFQLPDGSRDEFANDQFQVAVRSGSELLYEMDGNRVGVQDIPIFLTLATREEDSKGPGVALRGGVELPTGSPEAGFGNGNSGTPHLEVVDIISERLL